MNKQYSFLNFVFFGPDLLYDVKTTNGFTAKDFTHVDNQNTQ